MDCQIPGAINYARLCCAIAWKIVHIVWKIDDKTLIQIELN